MKLGTLFGLMVLGVLLSPVAMGTNQIAQGAAVLLAVVVLLVYFGPALIAYKAGHANTTGVALLNLFLGWTLLGWVVALVWACSRQSAPEKVQPAEAREASPVERYMAGDPATKACPYCAEQVLRAAIKCKHCGSSLVSGGGAVGEQAPGAIYGLDAHQ